MDGSVFDEVIDAIGTHRLILVGDLKQLPPVKYDQYGFFFEAMDYKEIHHRLTQIDLTRVKRQDNEKFVDILSKVRECKYNQEVFDFLKAHKTYDRRAPEDAIILASKNVVKDQYNNEAIQKLIDANVPS